MEHYLGEKLKKLRESRGWTQADLAKRLNKAVSTVSGYESDAHAIPLDVLASISSLFNISTDELLGLDAPEVLSLSGLTGAQKKTLIKLRNSCPVSISHDSVMKVIWRCYESVMEPFLPLSEKF